MEVDFVARKGGDIVYIQATMALEGESVVRREFGNLEGIADNYPKYVVVLNKGPLDSDMNGIRCIALKDFLQLEDLGRPRRFRASSRMGDRLRQVGSVSGESVHILQTLINPRFITDS